MIDVFDNVLEEHNAILVDDAVKKLSWKYDYSSEPTKPINIGMFYVATISRNLLQMGMTGQITYSIPLRIN